MSEKGQSRPSVLIVNDRWRYPLQGNAAAIIQLILRLTNSISKNVHCTVLYADEKIQKAAKRLGVELILPTPKGRLACREPSLDWLMGHKTYYGTLPELHNVKIVIGFEMTTSDAALDIRNELFCKAAFYLINTMDPEIVNRRILLCTQNTFCVCQTEYEEQVKQAEVVVSAEPKTYCIVGTCQKTSQSRFHLPPIPDDKYFMYDSRPYTCTEGEFRILSPVEPHQLKDNYKQLSDLAIAIESASTTLCKLSRRPLRWIILGVPSDDNEELKERLTSECSSFDIITHEYNNKVEVELLRSNLVLFPSNSLDSLGISLMAMAMAIPVLFAGKSQCQFLKKEHTIEFMTDIQCRQTELEGKLLYVIANHERCITKANSIRKALSEEVTEQDRTYKDFFEMMRADVEASEPRYRLRTRQETRDRYKGKDKAAVGLLPCFAERHQNEDRHKNDAIEDISCAMPPTVKDSQDKNSPTEGRGKREANTKQVVEGQQRSLKEEDEPLSVEDRRAHYLSGRCSSQHRSLDEWVVVECSQEDVEECKRSLGTVAVNTSINKCIPVVGKTIADVANAVYNLLPFKTTVVKELLQENPGTCLHAVKRSSVNYIMGCRTLEALEHLWSEYQSKRLSKLVERSIITDTTLAEVGATYLTLKTVINPEEYLKCKEELKSREGNRFVCFRRRHSMPDLMTEILFSESEQTMSHYAVDDIAVIRPQSKKKGRALAVGLCAMRIGKACIDTIVSVPAEDASVLRREIGVLKSRINLLERKIITLEREKQSTVAPTLSLLRDTAPEMEKLSVAATTLSGTSPDIAESQKRTEEDEESSLAIKSPTLSGTSPDIAESQKDVEEEKKSSLAVKSTLTEGQYSGASSERSREREADHKEVDDESQRSLEEEVTTLSGTSPDIAAAQKDVQEEKESLVAVKSISTESHDINARIEGSGERATDNEDVDEESRRSLEEEGDTTNNLLNVSWSKPWTLRFSPGLSLNHENSLIVVHRDENTLVTDPWNEHEEREIFTFDEFPRPTIPWDVAVSPGGNHYVTDIANRRVVVSDKEYNVIKTFGQNEDINPRGIAFTLDGNVVLTDFNGDFLRKYSSDGEHKAVFGGTGSEPGQFSKPYSLAVNSKNEMIVSDNQNHRIQVLNSDGDFITQFGNEDASPGELWFPKGVDVDIEDNVYVCDFGNNRVAKYDSDYEYLYDIATILCPIDIAVDSTDELVSVTDLPNQCIKRCGMDEAEDLMGLFLDFLIRRRFGLEP